MKKSVLAFVLTTITVSAALSIPQINRTLLDKKIEDIKRQGYTNCQQFYGSIEVNDLSRSVVVCKNAENDSKILLVVTQDMVPMAKCSQKTVISVEEL